MVKILPSEIDYADWIFLSKPIASIASYDQFSTFKPASTNSIPFESSSAPNLEPKKKTIIISDDAFRQGFSSFDIAKILHVLKQDGFEIKLALNDGNGESYLADLDERFEFLHKKWGKQINIFAKPFDSKIFKVPFDLKSELYSITSSNSDANKEQKLTQFRVQHNLNADETLVMNWHQTHELDKLYSKPLFCNGNLLSNAYGHFFVGDDDIGDFKKNSKAKKIVNSGHLQIKGYHQSIILQDDSTQESVSYRIGDFNLGDFNDDEKQKICNALLLKLTDVVSAGIVHDIHNDCKYILEVLNSFKGGQKLDPAILDKIIDTFIQDKQSEALFAMVENYPSLHFQFLDNEKYYEAYSRFDSVFQHGKIVKELKDFEISENYEGTMILLNRMEFKHSYIDLLSKDTLKKISEKLIIQFSEDSQEDAKKNLIYLNIIAKALSVEEFTNLIKENEKIFETTKNLIALHSLNYDFKDSNFKGFFLDIFKSLMQSDDPKILELFRQKSLDFFPDDITYSPGIQEILTEVKSNFKELSSDNFDPDRHRENNDYFKRRKKVNPLAPDYQDSTPSRKIYRSSSLEEVKRDFPEVEILDVGRWDNEKKLKFFPNLKFVYYRSDLREDIMDALQEKKIYSFHYPWSIEKQIAKPQIISQVLEIETPLSVLDLQPIQRPQKIQISTTYGVSDPSLSDDQNSGKKVLVGEQLRPETLQTKFDVRSAQKHLAIENVKSLGDDWMPKISRDFDFKKLGDSLVDSQAEEPRLITDSEEFDKLKKEKFKNFNPRGSETLASFNMQISGDYQVSQLLSISPDNKISAIFCEDPTAKISYYRSDDGFYFLQSDKACEISYLISGQELKNINITEKLDNKDLPEKILEILNRYKQGTEIKMSIPDREVAIPEYTIDPSTDLKAQNQKWLEKLFEQPNLSSCRHRVMSVASEFEKIWLKRDEDYRVIGVNNNHVLFEIKNNNGGWVRVDMGGSDPTRDVSQSDTASVANDVSSSEKYIAQTDWAPKVRKPLDSTQDDEDNERLKRIIEQIKERVDLEEKIKEKAKETKITVEEITQKNNCASCFTFLFTQKKRQKIDLSLLGKEELRDILKLYDRVPISQSPRQDPLITIVIPDLPKVDDSPKFEEPHKVQPHIDPPIEKLNIDFKKIFASEVPNIFLTSRAQSFLVDDPSAQPGKASVAGFKLHPSSKTALSSADLVNSDFTAVMDVFLQREDKKSLLLQSSSIQELKNYIIAWRAKADQESEAKSSSIFLVDSPQELKLSSKTIEIEGVSQGEFHKARAILNSKLKQFIEDVKAQDQASPKILLIDWAKFSDKEKVAFNTIFDASREIDGVKIPDSIKIVCIDSSKGQSSDASIASRFSECYNLVASAGELKDQTNLLIKDVPQDESQEKSQIAIDLAGYPNWQDKLFGAVTLQKDQLFWQKTVFVRAIENGCTEFKLSNIKKSDQGSLLKMLDTAKARGYIDYHGYQIKISPNLNISFDREEFKIADVLEKFQSSSVQDQDSKPSLKIYRDLKLTASNKLKTSFKIGDEKYELIVDSLEGSDIKLVNTLNFNKLLTIPKLDEDNKYYEEDGLIAKASKTDKVLKLLITSELSAQQYYYLLAQCAQEGVNLQLYLAGDVKLSFSDKRFNADIASEFSSQIGSGNSVIVESPSQALEQVSPARILVTNDANLALSKMLSGGNFSDTKPLIINSEDENFASLFGAIDSKVSASTHEKSSEEIKFEFHKKTSELLEILRSGRQVVIKGKFSEQLMLNLHSFMAGIKDKELDYLDPTLTMQNPLSNQYGFQNLHFIIEDKNLKKTAQLSQYSTLSFLDQELLTVEYQEVPIQLSQYSTSSFPDQELLTVKYHEVATKQQTEMIAESKRKNHQIVSSDSGAINSSCESFMRARKGLLTSHLIDSSSNALALISDAGSGKTALIDEIAENGLKQKGDVKIFKELDNIEAWAKDKSDDKTKILVIDEFNIDGTRNFTTFTDFVLGKTDTIFYQGRELVLSNKHKILFLGNPIEYGNRYSQKLFLDCDITQIKLENFPADYIYQKILKEPIYQPIQASQAFDKSFEISRGPIMSEDQFKQICQSKIDQYYKNLAQHKKSAELASQTVRKLQEEVLLEVAKEIKKSEVKTSKEVKTADFIATKVNAETIDKIQQAIDIRKYQQQRWISDKCVGTPGIILEGDSGVGKSAMVEAILQSNNISRLDRIDAITQDGSQYYFKIPANADKKTIETTLIKAFEKGIMVVMDEINTRLDEGLEKLLNSLLTGKSPDKIGENAPKITPGFMLISSINNSSHAGRASLSPALLSRCHHIKAKAIKEYEVQDFEEILSNWFESDKEKSRFASLGNLTKDDLQCSSSLFLGQVVNKDVTREIDASKKQLFEETAKKFIKEFAIECEKNKHDRNFNLRTLRGKYSDYLLEFAEQIQIDRFQDRSPIDRALYGAGR